MQNVVEQVVYQEAAALLEGRGLVSLQGQVWPSEQRQTLSATVRMAEKKNNNSQKITQGWTTFKVLLARIRQLGVQKNHTLQCHSCAGQSLCAWRGKQQSSVPGLLWLWEAAIADQSVLLLPFHPAFVVQARPQTPLTLIKTIK